MNVAQMLYRTTPEYLFAYEEGYEQAKWEMAEKLKAMKALHNTSSTISVEDTNEE